jgi:hypothetical protein
MFSTKNIKIMVILLTTLVLLNACGSGGNSNKDTNLTGEDNLQKDDNDNEDNNDIIVGYTAGDEVIIETKSDGTKLAWVNSTGDACLVYRVGENGNTPILEGGTNYCNDLNFSNIDTWRLPTVEEAVYFMNNVPINPNADQGGGTPNTDVNFIIYPNSGLTCLFMATTTNQQYVYTTNHDNNGSFSSATRATAGIRCVANQ